MEISEQLHCLFSAQLENNGDSYTIEVPTEEVELGTLEAGQAYRVAVLPAHSASEIGHEEQTEQEPADDTSRADTELVPPVEPGETRTVEIESLGEQGDGITRVDRGFVVIVPDTEQGERIRIEITDVRETVAFAEVIERLSYYD